MSIPEEPVRASPFVFESFVETFPKIQPEYFVIEGTYIQVCSGFNPFCSELTFPLDGMTLLLGQEKKQVMR